MYRVRDTSFCVGVSPLPQFKIISRASSEPDPLKPTSFGDKSDPGTGSYLRCNRFTTERGGLGLTVHNLFITDDYSHER